MELLIATCHRRGAHAMGGMAAQIPIKNDPEANEAALERVKRRQTPRSLGRPRRHVGGASRAGAAGQGHIRHLHAASQPGGPADLVEQRPPPTCSDAPHGPITEAGLALNVDVGVRYLAAWLGGNGCVPIYNLMEDAATAEICRAQVWQWVRHAAVMENGRAVTAALVGELMDATVEKLRAEIPALQLQMAASLCEEMMTSPDFPEFLTLAAYDHLD